MKCKLNKNPRTSSLVGSLELSTKKALLGGKRYFFNAKFSAGLTTYFLDLAEIGIHNR